MSKMHGNADKSAPVTAISGLTPNQVLKSIIRRFTFDGKQGPPIFLKGQPGIGKTDIGKQAAEKLSIIGKQWEAAKAKREKRKPRNINVRFERISAPQMGPEDIKGLPAADRSIQPPQAIWLKPYFLPMENAAGRDKNGNLIDKEGNLIDPVFMVLLVDELTTATKAVMASLLTLVLDRKVQEYTLPDGVCIMAAGNRMEDKTYTIQLSSALSNRFCHIDLKADLSSWFEWAYDHDINHKVVAFLKAKADTEPAIFSSPPRQDQPYPTPRGWEFVSSLLGDGFKENDPNEKMILDQHIKGIVGPGAGMEFIRFMGLYEKIPSVEEILKHPDKAEIPGGPDGKWAVITAVARRAKDKKNHKAIATYINRMKKADAAFGFIGVRDVLRENFDFAIGGDGDDLGGYMAEFLEGVEDVVFDEND